MKIGCQMAFNEYTSPSYIIEAAQHVEEVGFYGFWVPEHVMFFPEYESRYPYTEDGRIAGEPRSLLDPFSALTFVAAHTSRIKLATGICLVPQRNPVYTAKVCADLDYLSGGRFELGVGIGWLKEEFDALGVPWEDRAGRTLECLAVMKTLWCDEVSSFDGKYYTVQASYQNPKPVQQPHPPIIFGARVILPCGELLRLGRAGMASTSRRIRLKRGWSTLMANWRKMVDRCRKSNFMSAPMLASGRLTICAGLKRWASNR